VPPTAAGPTDGRVRCGWGGAWADPAYVAYHDEEWGVPVRDERRLFELLVLEGAQAGLSWSTVLHRRGGYRRAFEGFDPAVVAGYGEPEVQRLLQDAGIIRHRGKIEATVNNAGRALELIDEFGSLDTYLWGWEPEVREPDVRDPSAVVPASTATSTALSKELKKRGWRFVGPTTVYAFMQAMGLVDDHDAGCEWRRT
jgi:DNA-3-methyladenine glycosylase I